ncbi:unnamed protein product [Coregonus sp. 'balchen']|nr:unnamed protein product [Coregonus sp. 'balchen']
MRLKLRNLLQFMWNRRSNSGHQCVPYIRDIRQLQSEGFYRVYVGETEIPEGLITGDISTVTDTSSSRHTWSVIHAGGQRGWVPWNYKLLFHCSGVSSLQPSGEIFEELCGSLRENYGKCAIVVNNQSWRSPRKGNGCNYVFAGYVHHLPEAPVDLMPMTCCPAAARAYGHELIQIPFQCAHLSPLNSAWSTVKWFATNDRGKYSEAIYDRDTLHKYIYWNELMEGALKKMTNRKWEEALSRVRKNENHYLNDKQ